VLRRHSRRSTLSALRPEATEAIQTKGGIDIGELIAVPAVLFRFGRLWVTKDHLAIDSQAAIGGIKKGRVSGEKVAPLPTKWPEQFSLPLQSHTNPGTVLQPIKGEPNGRTEPGRNTPNTNGQISTLDQSLLSPELNPAAPKEVVELDNLATKDMAIEQSLLSPSFLKFVIEYLNHLRHPTPCHPNEQQKCSKSKV
jgi:hypothetical protein